MSAIPYLAMTWIRQAAITARRKGRRTHYVAWSVVAGIANGLAITLGLVFLWLLWIVSLWWLAIPMASLIVLPYVASAALRYVLVPAGYTKLAYYAGLYSRPGTDAPAFALCAAAWAARDGEAMAWVEAKRDARKPLGDGEIAATALLAAGRGDADSARALLRSLVMIVEDHAAVREIAGEWLACDAAERSAWQELADSASAARWPATPLTFLLEGIAARRVDAAGAPGARELWSRWLIAPRRAVTAALVREALSAPPLAPMPAAVVVASSDEPLPHAVAAHLAFAAAPPTAESLARTVAAWDAALGDVMTREWLTHRALELDAPIGATDRALADVAGAVTDDLARQAELAQLGAPPDARGLVGNGLTRRLRHGRLDALDAAFTRWADHRHAPTHRAAIDEWREFVALWSAYEGVVVAGGRDLRRLAFPHAFTQSSYMASFLWNKREEYAMSHAISTWLLAEALAVGDTEAIELGHRNCALAVPTRLGSIRSSHN